MSLQDFCGFYSDLDICSSSPDFIDGSPSHHWKSSSHEGRWVAGISAGGCMNNFGTKKKFKLKRKQHRPGPTLDRFNLLSDETFWTNPQYRVEVGGSDNRGEKNMLVSLMQKPDKRNRGLVQNLFIGFLVFEVSAVFLPPSMIHLMLSNTFHLLLFFKVPKEYKAVKGKFPTAFFGRNMPVARVDGYINAREVMQLMSLKPGEYLIVPSTFNPNKTASFILTVLSKAETRIQ
ncbi:hypothetical protein CCH79_00004318 [Gambusia affinis]|uniref:Peptidase C2 calpain domain-containing protein n=1 Tax=Gambusia affinis TaxID=33528 RepID=A0A315UXV3_GAMAF|nr:hypothetical protein CCH79_00004318 [Gambusia affinis]